MRACYAVLKKVMGHKFAWPFKEPVDAEALKIPDYHEVIKHPMDFGTIRDQLEECLYESAEDFCGDVRLVFSNACTYNNPDSDVYMMAKALQEFFDKEYEKAISRIDPNVAVMHEKMTTLQKKMHSMQQELRRLKRQKARQSAQEAQTTDSGAAPKKKKPAKRRSSRSRVVYNEDKRPMSFDEKRKLSMSIKSLPPESLGSVIQIIHDRMPTLAKQSPDEIEIDIDALDAATLRTLERFIRNTLKTSRSKSRPTSDAVKTNEVPHEDKLERTKVDTDQRIADVERQLKALGKKAGEEKEPLAGVDVKGEEKSITPLPPASAEGSAPSSLAAVPPTSPTSTSSSSEDDLEDSETSSESEADAETKGGVGKLAQLAS
eukprot:TRINITY_DN248_c0_g2_i1.p1 TRINITY_DN248_c0_g2~~TRINITY_DN248_c0_g2_i1.p1  ORF type:complete len:392 (+),score=-4.98 TRINITY_DN248_c0_g2_i1:53-1177(+)